MDWGYSPRPCGDTALWPALTLLRGRAQPGRPKAASLAVLSAHLPFSLSSPHGGSASQSFPQIPTSRSSPINITVDRVTPKQGLTVFRIIFLIRIAQSAAVVPHRSLLSHSSALSPPQHQATFSSVLPEQTTVGFIFFSIFSKQSSKNT